MSRKLLFQIVSVIALLTMLAGCAQPAAAPVTVVQTQVVEKEKVVTQVVEKVVEKTVVEAATPMPPAPGVNGPVLLRSEFGVAPGAPVDAAVVPGWLPEEWPALPAGDDG